MTVSVGFLTMLLMSGEGAHPNVAKMARSQYLVVQVTISHIKLIWLCIGLFTTSNKSFCRHKNYRYLIKKN